MRPLWRCPKCFSEAVVTYFNLDIDRCPDCGHEAPIFEGSFRKPVEELKVEVSETTKIKSGLA